MGSDIQLLIRSSYLKNENQCFKEKIPAIHHIVYHATEPGLPYLKKSSWCMNTMIGEHALAHSLFPVGLHQCAVASDSSPMQWGHHHPLNTLSRKPELLL